MPAQINMISTRPNTNTDFWWTTTDPTVVSFRNDWATLFNENNVPSVQTISSNGLTCTVSYHIEQPGGWPDLVAEARIRMPNIFTNRPDYHIANNHTLKLEIRAMTGEVLREIPVVPAA